MKSGKNTVNFGEIAYPMIIGVLLLFKSYTFYSGLHLGAFPLAFAFATVAIVLAAYSFLCLISPKLSAKVLTVIYFLISILFAFDGVYYSYTSKLLSVTQLGMAGQLDDITDTIVGLIKPKDVMQVLDLPLWLLYFFNRRLILGKFTPLKRFSLFEKIGQIRVGKTVTAIGGLILSLILSFGVIFFPEFESEYMINEILCYHANDIYVNLIKPDEERIVDKSKYTSPDYSDYEFFGIAEDRNVIVIQVEAMQNFVLGAFYDGQEITPNLNKLIKNDSFYFDHYYYQIGGGNTADAEFHVNNSLFAPESNAAYMQYADNTYYGLPHLLKNKGYSGAYAYHGYIASFWNREYAYPGQGFDDYISLEDFEQNDVFGMGLSDRQLFTQSMELLKTYKEPFYAFYITLSSHYPYGIPIAERDIVLKPEDEQTLFGLYIQSMNYVDKCIGEFIDMLEESGLYENTMLVIYGDHYGLGNTDVENAKRFTELTGRDYTLYDMFNVPLIINVPGINHNEVVSIAGGHIDTLPTMLYLLGITNDKAVMFGQNLIEAEIGFVCQQTHMSIGSFINNEVLFKKPHNNIKSNYDAYEYGTMARLDFTLFEDESDYAAEKIKDCAALLEDNDVLLD